MGSCCKESQTSRILQNPHRAGVPSEVRLNNTLETQSNVMNLDSGRSAIILALLGLKRSAGRSILAWIAIVFAVLNLFPTAIVMGGW